MNSPDLSVSADLPSESRNRVVLVVYTAAIFVSALLLFSVQPRADEDRSGIDDQDQPVPALGGLVHGSERIGRSH